jgi:hypothetical protein
MGERVYSRGKVRDKAGDKGGDNKEKNRREFMSGGLLAFLAIAMSMRVLNTRVRLTEIVQEEITASECVLEQILALIRGSYQRTHSMGHSICNLCEQSC